jgi:hypothetical protein
MLDSKTRLEMVDFPAPSCPIIAIEDILKFTD